MLADIQWNLDVFLSGQGRDQVERLEDHADLTVAHNCQLALGHASDIHVINQHLPGSGIVQPGDNTQQCAFPGPGRPDNGDKLSAHNRKTNAFKNVDALATKGKALRDITDIHHYFAPRLWCLLFCFENNGCICIHVVFAPLSLLHLGFNDLFHQELSKG